MTQYFQIFSGMFGVCAGPLIVVTPNKVIGKFLKITDTTQLKLNLWPIKTPKNALQNTK